MILQITIARFNTSSTNDTSYKLQHIQAYLQPPQMTRPTSCSIYKFYKLHVIQAQLIQALQLWESVTSSTSVFFFYMQLLQQRSNAGLTGVRTGPSTDALLHESADKNQKNWSQYIMNIPFKKGVKDILCFIMLQRSSTNHNFTRHTHTYTHEY